MEHPKFPTGLTKEQEAAYDHFFQQLDTAGSGFLSEEKGTIFFGRSRLPLTVLSKIWKICDVDQDGQLNMYEFRVAMLLVHFLLQHKFSLGKEDTPTQVEEHVESRNDAEIGSESQSKIHKSDTSANKKLRPEQMDVIKSLIPESLPRHLASYIRSKAGSASFVMDESVVECDNVENTVAVEQKQLPVIVGKDSAKKETVLETNKLPSAQANPERDALQEKPPVSRKSRRALQSTETRSYATEEEPYLDIAFTEESDKKFSDIFKRLDVSEKGFISESTGTLLFSRSKLPIKYLGHIWALSDIDRDGKLDHDEFRLAMYLIDAALDGKQLPSRLPRSVIPASKQHIQTISKTEKSQKIGQEVSPLNKLLMCDRSLESLEAPLHKALSYMRDRHPKDYEHILMNDDFLTVRKTVEFLKEEHGANLSLFFQLLGIMVENFEILSTPMIEAGLIPVLINTIRIKPDIDRIYASLLLSWLCKRQLVPYSEQKYMDPSFYELVLELIMDSTEEEIDHYFSLLFALYCQLGSTEGQKLVEKIISKEELHEFLPLLIKTYNRMEVDAAICCQLLTDIVEHPDSTPAFYTNDVKVLIDVIIRQLRDLTPGNELRPLIMQLLRSIQIKDGFYPRQDVVHGQRFLFRQIEVEECLNSIASLTSLDVNIRKEQKIAKSILSDLNSDEESLFRVS